MARHFDAKSTASIKDNAHLCKLLSLIGEDSTVASGINELLSFAKSSPIDYLGNFLRKRANEDVIYHLTVDDLECLISLYAPEYKDPRMLAIKAISGRVSYITKEGDMRLIIQPGEQFDTKGNLRLVFHPL